MSISGKNLDFSSNKAFVPSAYKLKVIDITNYRGETKDIQNIAVKMSISESLYSQSLVLNLTLKDSTNFIEEFPIIGQEKIRIAIEYKKRNGQLKTLNLKFYISEYPTFGSTERQNYVQIIRLVGISEQSYISNQKKISKGFTDNTANLIKKILKEDLLLSDKEFRESEEAYKAISSMKGIINTQRPMDAIEFLRRQTFDVNYSPFFFFQTLNGKYKLFSLASLIDDEINKVFETYYDTRDFNTEAGTEADYLQRAKRILSVSSELKLNKSIQARRGAFASKNRYLNYSDKSYTKYEYRYDRDFVGKKPTLEGKTIISDQFLIGGDSLNTFVDSHCEYISLNSKAFEGDQSKNYNQESVQSRHFLNAYNALFNTFTHDIRLNGDFKLNAGRKIELEFPKAIDPSSYKEYTNKPFMKHYNEFLSGKYLITSAIHEFENNEYYVNIRVKRDSFSVDV
jgi:hypothetical protein